jgi:hypothetical protein
VLPGNAGQAAGRGHAQAGPLQQLVLLVMLARRNRKLAEF